MQKREIEISYS